MIPNNSFYLESIWNNSFDLESFWTPNPPQDILITLASNSSTAWLKKQKKNSPPGHITRGKWPRTKQQHPGPAQTRRSRRRSNAEDGRRWQLWHGRTALLAYPSPPAGPALCAPCGLRGLRLHIAPLPSLSRCILPNPNGNGLPPLKTPPPPPVHHHHRPPLTPRPRALRRG
jgi:hypothetical protein